MARIQFGLGKPVTTNISWIFLLVGGLFVCIGTGFCIHSISVIHGSKTCEGVVVGIAPKSHFQKPSTAGESEVDSNYGNQMTPNETTTTVQTKPSAPTRSKKPSTGRGGSTVPEVEYQVNGVVYLIHGMISTSPPAYSIGEKVMVYYSPDHPGDGVIGSFIELWLMPVVFGGIGSVFSLGGGFIVLRKLTNPVT